MKVLMLNGSPHEKGCTYTALCKVGEALFAHGIEYEIVHIGKKPVGGCTACGGCKKTGRCAFDDGRIAEIAEKMQTADAFVVGSPVYYASANGSLIGIMDRLFMTASGVMKHKPAAAVVSARRAGTSATLDILQKYFAYGEMPVVSSWYWNMVHGSTPADVEKDVEGVQVMHRLGDNMAWLLFSIAAGREKGIAPPAPEVRKTFNYIR